MSQQMLSKWVKREPGVSSEQGPPPNSSSNAPAASRAAKPAVASIDAYKYSPAKRDPYRSKYAARMKGYAVGGSKRSASTEEDEDAPKRAKTTKLTPLEQQIYDLKQNNKDKLLAVQVGYKYKFFGQDAQVASQVLNIMFIPGRLFGSGPNELYDKFAYCSIPDVRLHVHLKRLLSAGHKVAIVDQDETAAIKSTTASKNKLFQRKISRVYTSSTYIDDDQTTSGGRFVVALKETGSLISFVAVDVYSSDIVYDEFEDTFVRGELETRLHHLDPSEFLLIGDLSKETAKSLELFKMNTRATSQTLRTETRPVQPYTEVTAVLDANLHNEAFDLVTKLSTGLQTCFSELIAYLGDFSLASVFDLAEKYTHFAQVDRCMILDANTLKNLEIFKNSTNGQETGSLLWMMDHTKTRFGRRELRRWIGRPLTDREAIAERADSVENIVQSYQSIPIESTVRILKDCPDLETALSRVHYGRSKRKEVFLFLRKVNDILQFYGTLPDQLNQYSPHLAGIFRELKQLATVNLKQVRELFAMIHSPSAIDDSSDEHVTRFFNTSFYNHAQIQHHVDSIAAVEQQLQDELKNIRAVIKRPGLNYITNNKEPYLIEVRNTQVATLPKDWVKINGTKSVGRFRSPATAALYKQIQLHTELLLKQCDECFQDFVSKIDEHYLHLNRTIRQLAVLDCLISLGAASSLSQNYSKPQIVDVPCIDLKNSRNPISEHLKASGYIANSFHMSRESGRIAIITGPNMGGKSSFIRQVALCVVMAQVGAFIPADQGSRLSIFTNILTRMGAQDDLIKGESTFQVELSECSTILRQCDSRSLVLMDEVGRGTSTVDGYAIAHAILHYLVADTTPFVLFITHYQNLQTFDRFKEVDNYHMGIQKLGEDILFTYKLSSGASDRSYGINCAKVAGLPQTVLDTASMQSVRFETEWNLKQAYNLAQNYSKLTQQKDYAKLLDLTHELA
ncbi:hypothetical protein OGAPHI_002985 [Ogataea philodendri]|uniref:DNA mismatch repair protein MSH3 n=1 Tax=Ogataea philodendri TaxID=1378263 RepID=A0A9P8T616_9ASCO|nr:uncharacterized protein OGAPHI_002985 [Ogataea philodendri]KAH3667336.1 hypothetical protein OGAPHI_002985 [Ogataea philodendri]